MTDIPSEALHRVMDQIEIIKKYSGAIDESQGLIANAITQLIMFDGLQSINVSLRNLQTLIEGGNINYTQDKPRIFVP